MSELSWWVSIDGKPTGPLSEAEIKQRLVDGKLQPDAYVCQVGTEEWKRASECPEFGHLNSAPTPPQAPPPPPDTPPAAKPSLNPLAIAWLGLLFTPIWTGIMAAINAKRLGLNLPLWRPLAIGVGSQIVVILTVLTDWDPGTVIDTLIFTVAPLVAIWSLDLEPQMSAHKRKHQPTQDHWIGPVLAGSPLALVTIVGWWLTLFAPLEPLEVVERFMEAETPEEARQYVTSNLYQMVDDIHELNKLEPTEVSEDDRFEILREYPAEEDENQYFIEHRMYFAPKVGEPATSMQAHFHLRRLDGEWKLEEWAITSVDGQESEVGPVSFGVILSETLKEAKQNAANQPKPKPGWSLTKLWDMIPQNLKRLFAFIAAGIAWGAVQSRTKNSN